MRNTIVGCLFVGMAFALLQKAGSPSTHDLSRNRIGLMGLGFLLLGGAVFAMQLLKLIGITN